MKELLKKIMERAENPETVDLSEAGVRKAAKELGYSDEQIAELFANFDGFPLDEYALGAITGGAGTTYGNKRRAKSGLPM